nr:TPA_asm: m03 uORF RNA *1 [Murid betaherpesvirus 1]DBA07703.1 TPA_asm: m03 uORF RNA *1 [Murid betaherpesvirus 1]
MINHRSTLFSSCEAAPVRFTRCARMPSVGR